MKKTVYLYIALVLGLFLLATLFGVSKLAAEGRSVIPLLALLIISEFGFISSAIGAVIGLMAIKNNEGKLKLALVSVACGAMSVRFMLLGMSFWPQ